LEYLELQLNLDRTGSNKWDANS